MLRKEEVMIIIFALRPLLLENVLLLQAVLLMLCWLLLLFMMPLPVAVGVGAHEGNRGMSGSSEISKP